MATIDNLNIQISANATKATTALDGLVKKLDLLTKSLGKVNGNSVQNFSTSMNTLSQAMQRFKSTNVSAKNFETVAKGIGKFANIDANKIASVGNSLIPLSNSVNTLSNIKFDNKNLQNLINSLTRLSNANLKSLQNVDFTAFGNAMTQLATSLSNAPKIQQSIISMTNAIAYLAKSGGNIGAVSSGLPALSIALNNFIRSISTAPQVSASTIQLTQAIGNLANVGAKAQTTASNLQNLAIGLKKAINILSKSPNINRNIIDMTNALASLASQGRNVNTVTNTLSRSMRTYNTTSSTATKQTLSLAAAFGKLYANYWLFLRVFRLFKNSIVNTSDYIEAFNYYNVAFNKIASDWGHDFEKYGYENAEDYSKSFTDRMNDSLGKLSGIKFDEENMRLVSTEVKNLGLNIQEVTQYAAQLASVTNSVGLSGEASLAAADSFTKLAGDISSLYNVDYKTVAQNLQSGLIGQSRALYKYGIDITNATLQTYAFKLGLEKAVSEMTQAEKMQLRMIAILDQSRVSWGDLANTINQPANQMRVLKAQAKELSMMFGQLFVPMLSKVIPVITGLVIALKRLMGTIADFFGIKIDYSNMSQGFNDMEVGAEELTGELDEVSKSAEKAKAGLRGFDELKTINMPDTSGNSDAGGMLDLTKEILAATEEYQKVWDEAFDKMKNQADEIANRIQNAFTRIANVSKYVAGIWSSGFKASFDTTSLETAQQHLSGISTQLHNIFGNKELQYSANTFFKQYLFDLGRISADVANIGLSLVNNLLGGIEKYLSGNSDRITQYFVNMFDIGTIISKTIGDIMDDISEIFKVFEGENATNFTSNLLEMFLNPLMSIRTVLASFIRDYLGGIKTIINDNKEQISTALDNLFLVLSTWTKPLADALTSIGEGWVETYNTHISPAIKNFTEVFSNLGKTILKLWNEHIAPFLKDSGIIIGELMQKYIVPAVKDIIKFGGQIIELISTVAVFLQPVISFIAETFAPVIMNNLELLRNAAVFVFETIGNAIKTVMGILTGLMDFVIGVFTGDLKRAGEGLTNVFDSIKNAITSYFQSVIKLVIGDLDTLNSAIYEIFSGISGWFGANVITPIVETFSVLWEKVSGYFSELWNGIVSVWSGVSNWFSTNVIEPVVGFFQGLQTRVQQIFEGLWIIVQAIWKVSSEWFNSNVIVPITNLFETIWTNVSTFFKNLWEEIKNVWTVASEWFNNTIITPIISVFETAGTAILNVFNGIWNGIKKGMAGAMNAVIGGIENGINFIVDGINDIISGFNRVVSWAAQIAEVDWGGVSLIPTVSLPRINGYATGGFPNTADLFYANENGIPELVGTVGGRTAVASGTEITGISDAIYVTGQTEAELLRTAISLLQVIADKEYGISSDAIFKSVQKSAKTFSNRTGRLAFE